MTLSIEVLELRLTYARRALGLRRIALEACRASDYGLLLSWQSLEPAP